MRWYIALFFGLFVTVLQLAFAMGVQGRKTVESAYRNLYQWDSEHYAEIAENGYRSSIPNPPPTDEDSRYFIEGTNVAFFPGYPLAIRFVQFFTRLDFRFAALLAAQIAAVGFWAFFILFLQRLGLAPAIILVGVVAVLAHPAAFYLVTAYSESLFLFTAVAFLYADHARSVRARSGQIAAGMTMTATRLFGIPVAGYSLVRSLFGDAPKTMRTFARPIIIGAAAALGAILFFLYCAAEFEYWDLYMRRQQWGWGIETDLLAPAQEFFRLLVPSFAHGKMDVNAESRISASVALWALLVVMLIDWGFSWKTKNRSWRMRAPLYILAAGTWYLLVAALFSMGYQSMIRYTLSVHVFLLAAALHLLASAKPSCATKILLGIAFGIAVFFGVLLQIVLAYRFTHGGWVA